MSEPEFPLRQHLRQISWMDLFTNEEMLAKVN